MKKTDVLSLLLKVLGAYLSLSIINNLSVLFYSFSFFKEANYVSQTDFMLTMLVPYFAVIFSLAFIYFCLFKTNVLTNLLMKNEEDNTIALDFNDKNQFIELSLIISALINIVWSIPELVVNIKTYSSSFSSLFIEVNPDFEFINLTILRFLVGVIIIKFAPQISNYISPKRK